ncbi:ATP-binding protein [Lentibacter sp. XHP0401]|uniref:hybrid sensor histidine kinase/response regulator n=1 Tax=Lentibacter sp. XHP0401 TaxID=2984334 RepID=UPI0021E7DEE0|nr:ATP-binding protein [Lentibacter sp. XHP0401]MCV2893528.1 ATP-binding protein [Lentibacter sp. XHP0401]
MPADDLEFEQMLTEFEARHSPEGLLERYARQRPAYFWFRQVFALGGAAVLFLTGHPQAGLLALGTLVFGDLVDCAFLSTVPRKLAKGVPHKQLYWLTTLTALIQSLTSLALIILPTALGSPSATLAFTMAFIAGAGVNASYLLSFHPAATIVRLATLFASGIGILAYVVWQRHISHEAQLYSFFAFFMILFLIYTFLQYSRRGFAHKTKSARRLLEQSRKLALANKVLHEQESEVRRLALVAQHANDSVFVSDSSGRILWVNNAFTRLTGYSAREAIGAFPAALLNGPATDAATNNAIISAIKAGKPLRTEILNTCKDGSTIWVDTNQVPVLAADGSVEMFIAIERDVSARKKHAKELAAAKRSAEEGERTKAQFLATMSHEIRTPMNGIIGMADLLRDAGLSKEQRSYVETIRYSAEALMRIINDILDFSKLDAGKSIICPVDFDLLGCVESALSILRPKALEKEIFVDLNCHTPLPALLHGDDGRIRQIIINIVGNAIKFTRAGGVTIDLSCTTTAAGHTVTLAVTDTGIGIPADRIDQIFDQFSQADGEITRQYGGTGLGLTISRILAHEMNGDITIRSRLGEGSTFTITLMLDHALADAAQSPSKSPKTDAVKAVKLPGVKALVAEDNMTNQLLMKSYLKDTEMNVLFAGNGHEAVRLARRHAPRVIFMDMSMPGMDGLSATRKIRADTSITQPTIVALTANVYASDKAACLSAGMDGFLSKPLKRAELMGWLNQI